MEKRMNPMPTWAEYYDAETFVVCDGDRARDADYFQHKHDALLADKLSAQMWELIYERIGLRWVNVASDDLSSARTWFAHGDPWTVLVGVGLEDVIVGQPQFTLFGMMGPSRLLAANLADPIVLTPDLRIPLERLERRQAASKSTSDSDLSALREAIESARKQSRRGIRLCRSCQSPRYGGDCRCEAYAEGTVFD